MIVCTFFYSSICYSQLVLFGLSYVDFLDNTFLSEQISRTNQRTICFLRTNLSNTQESRVSINILKRKKIEAPIHQSKVLL
jgi:hypothetical protein